MSREKTVIQLLPLLVLIAGILVRLVVFLQNRSLFIDEANLALNILEKSGNQFFQTLDYQQYAPPLFLLFEKASTLLFGTGEMAFRLLPFTAGVLGLYLFALVVKKWLPLPCFHWFPLFLLAFSPMLIQYATEIKQYSTDVLTNIFFIYLAVKWPYQDLTFRQKLGWIALGMAAIWWSMPVVFVLFGVGCYYGFQAHQKEGFPGVVSLIPIPFFWLLSFGLYYYAILAVDLDKNYLVDYHRPYFLPLLPLDGNSWQRWLNVWSVFIKISLGGTVIAYCLGGLLTVLGLRFLAKRHLDRLILILFPIISCLFASALEKYSLMPRLALFLMPNIVLLLGIGLSQCWLLLHGKWSKIVLVIPLIIVIVNWNGYRYFIDKMGWEDSREVLAFAAVEASPQSFAYISHELIPAYRYYHEYHPQSGNFVINNPYLAKWNDRPGTVLKDQAFPPTTILLFSHLVNRKAVAKLQQQVGQLDSYTVEKTYKPTGAVAFILSKK